MFFILNFGILYFMFSILNFGNNMLRKFFKMFVFFKVYLILLNFYCIIFVIVNLIWYGFL